MSWSSDHLSGLGTAMAPNESAADADTFKITTKASLFGYRCLLLCFIINLTTRDKNTNIEISTMSAKYTANVVSGKSVLRKLLQSKHEVLNKAPVLVVSSAVPSDYTSVAAVDTACRKVQFYTGMELGLRTVESNVTSVFPTVNHVHSTLELMKRMGATNIIGVGSGAAMDLTKALMNKTSEEGVEGILVPSTYGAILAATSSHPLLLDTREEALIVPEHGNKSDGGGNKNDGNMTVVIEMDSLADAYGNDAAFACYALGIDASYRGQQEHADNLVLLAKQALEDDSKLPEALVQAGRATSFGIYGTSVRSSPLALAASLIPPSFPNVPILTFMASLLPGTCQVLHNAPFNETENSVPPSLASLMAHADGAQSVSSLMSHVKANQALWKCIDIPDDRLEAILHYSLNR